MYLFSTRRIPKIFVKELNIYRFIYNDVRAKNVFDIIASSRCGKS